MSGATHRRTRGVIPFSAGVWVPGIGLSPYCTGAGQQPTGGRNPFQPSRPDSARRFRASCQYWASSRSTVHEGLWPEVQTGGLPGIVTGESERYPFRPRVRVPHMRSWSAAGTRETFETRSHYHAAVRLWCRPALMAFLGIRRNETPFPAELTRCRL
jgi:hypothetical protein